MTLGGLGRPSLLRLHTNGFDQPKTRLDGRPRRFLPINPPPPRRFQHLSTYHRNLLPAPALSPDNPLMEATMKGILAWMIGIPIPIIILLYILDIF